MSLKFLLSFVALLVSLHVMAQPDTLGWRLERFKYPYTVKIMKTRTEDKPVEIAYMDERPATWNGKTVILLHGKNFPAAYWGKTMSTLLQNGYRVIAPDALGFGKSSKPAIRYSFSLLAALTIQLMDTLLVDKAAVIGHSTGGMLAVRLALDHRERVSKMVLANPIGLEDWRAKGVPYRKIDVWYEEEKTLTYTDVEANHRQYYSNWDEIYRVCADVQYGQMKGQFANQYAMVSAQLYDMILTETVLYEFDDIKTPTLIVIGNDDKTKIARRASAEVAARLGNYKKLGKATRRAIPHSRLVQYDNCGHLPFFEREADFNKDVLKFLSR